MPLDMECPAVKDCPHPPSLGSMRFAAFAILVLCTTHARVLRAQASLVELQPGARVRVEAPGAVAGRYVGTILTRSGDTLTLGGPNAAPVRLTLDRFTSVEISRGKSRSKGALRGIAWGAPIGLAIGLLTSGLADDCVTCTNEPSDAEGVTFATLGGVLWGAGIGALIGRERWERFQLASRTSLLLHPDTRSIAIVVRR